MKTLTTNTKSSPTTWEKAARIISLIAVILGLAGAVHAQSTYSDGTYRTKASGNFNDPLIWEYYVEDDSSWHDTTVAPDFTVGLILIANGHTVTVTDSIQIDETIVEVGGELILSDATTGDIYLHNGPNHDLNIVGTFRHQSVNHGFQFLTVGPGGTTHAELGIDSGGTYIYEADGGAIPYASWHDSATVIISGIDTATKFIDQSFAQSFGKFIWDSDSQSDTFHIRSTGTSPISASEFKITTTGFGAIDLGDTGFIPPTFNRFIMDGGKAYINFDGARERSLTITQNFSMFGGQFIVNNSDKPNAAGNLRVVGDFILNGNSFVDIATNTENGSISVVGNVIIGDGSTLTRSATGGSAGTANFVFLPGQVRDYINSGNVTGAINWNVSSGADVNLDTNRIYGSFFQNNLDSRLRIGHHQGIAPSGVQQGNIQTALRTFSEFAYYEYDGTVAQVTGEGLPNRIAAEIDTLIIGGLIINNTGGGVTLSQATRVSGRFSLQNGRLFTAVTELLTLGTTAYFTADSGSTNSHVAGPMARRTNSVEHYYFPFGDDGVFKPISIEPQTAALHLFTAEAHNQGFISSNVQAPLNNVSILEYWRIAQDSANANAVIRLYWNEDSNVEQPDTDLRVARFEFAPNNYWVDEGHDDINPTEMWVEAEVAGSNIAARTNDWTPFTFGSLTGANPLPVELISFTGRLMEASVLLEWATASEKDNDYFIVERSLDARHFAQVGERVAGHGTSARTINYSMVDDNNVSGNEVLYYRLRQVDFDGTEHVSKTIAVHPGKHNERVEVAVHPNPFVSDLNVTVSGSANGQFDIRVMDMTGKVVASETGFLNNGNARVNLPVHTLQAGVYMVHVNSGSNQAVTKIVKR